MFHVSDKRFNLFHALEVEENIFTAEPVEISLASKFDISAGNDTSRQHVLSVLSPLLLVVCSKFCGGHKSEKQSSSSSG